MNCDDESMIEDGIGSFAATEGSLAEAVDDDADSTTSSFTCSLISRGKILGIGRLNVPR